MNKDEDIKSEVSPFKIQENEIKRFDGHDGYVSINQIVNKLNREHITEYEYKILEIVGKYEFITSRQIRQILELEGTEPKSDKAFGRKLAQMVATRLLSRYYFGSFDSVASYRVYCLDKNGKYLLDAREVKTNWKPTDNTKTVGVMKRRLAANQTIIAMKTKVNAYSQDESKKEILDKTGDKKIKSMGYVAINKEMGKAEILIETVRREEAWGEILENRFKVYKNFYDNFKMGDSGFIERPSLLLVCEDKKHMAEVYKELVIKGLLPADHSKIFYTYDLKQLEPKLTNTWYEFVHEEDKIKLQPLNIPILD